jgi:major type 1 subunit fimbrin (pilin)
MKHKLLALATAAAALTPMISSASDGTITFNGTISAVTCTIASPSFTVTLPTVSVNTLGTSGAFAGATRFPIAISACSGGATANAFFEAGTTVDATTGRLKIDTGVGKATNVDLQLLTAAGSVIDLSKPYGSQNTSTTAIVSNAATLEYVVRYYATGPSTPGSVNSTVTYSVVYN